MDSRINSASGDDQSAAERIAAEDEQTRREKRAARAQDLNRQQQELIRAAIERMAKCTGYQKKWYRRFR